MSKTLIRSITLAVSVLLLTAGSAGAQPFYVALMGGINATETRDVDLGPFGAELDRNRGVMLAAAAGIHLPHNLRTEAEFTVRRNGVGGPIFTAGFEDDLTGFTVSYGAMANLWYDVPIWESFQPYVGGGVGIALHQVKSMRIEDSGGRLRETTEPAFAYQLGGGFNIPVAKHWTLTIDHRFHRTSEVTFDETGGPLGDLDIRINSFSVMGGFRYTFGHKDKR